MNPEDLRVESYRHNPNTTGMGVWRAPTAVKVTHIPTGLSVICSSERSMYANRVKAMEELEAALTALNFGEKI